MPRHDRHEGRISRRTILKGAAAAGVGLAAGPWVLRKAWAQQPIVIGHLNTFTGDLASLGQYGRWGLQTALNLAGGKINNRPVKVIEADDAFKTDQATREAERLILRHNVDVITGVSSSAICVKLSPVVDRFKTLFILGTGCETTTLTGDGSPCPRFTFRPYNSTKSQAIAMAPWGLKNVGKRWFGMYMDFAWGQSVAFDFRKELERLGGVWVGHIGTPIGTQDYVPHLSRVPSDVEGIMLGYSGGDAIRIILALNETGLGKKMKLVGPASTVDVNTIPQQGRAAVGTFSLHRYPAVKKLEGSPFDDPFNRRFRAEFAKFSGGELPAGFSQAQFTGFNIIKTAFEAVNYQTKEDSERVVRWLENDGKDRTFPKSNENPQGDLLLRAADHQGFVNFYMATVNDRLEFGVVGDVVPMKSTLYPANCKVA